MAHCLSCNSLLTKNDTECYVCGERAPKRETFVERKASSPLSNLVFMASLGFSGYSFVNGHQTSLAVSLGVSGLFMAIRLIDWLRQQNFAPRKAKVAQKPVPGWR